MYKVSSNFDNIRLSDYIIDENREKSQSKLIDIIENGGITSYFQPIVDLFTCNIFGYEMLARGSGKMFFPEDMFRCARDHDMEWELEYACRKAALIQIANLKSNQRDKYFFLNVSPTVFNSNDFQSGFTSNYIKEKGLNHTKIVLEITETATIEHYDIFEKLIKHYKEQGFKIALDDFGAGHSGLATLVTITPHFMKIDKDIIQGISESNYKQKLLKTLCNFASDVGSNILAEGIENFDDLETIYRLGVRYAQGFYFGMPSPFANNLTEDIRNQLARLISRLKLSDITTSQFLNDILVQSETFNIKSITCKEMDLFFKRNQMVDHVVILDSKIPFRLITRQQFYKILGGRFGFSVHSNHLVEQTIQSEFLQIKSKVDLLTIKKIALSRNGNEAFDPIVILDDDNRLVGTITMKKLIEKAIDLEILNAVNQNPLTLLPGNNAIKRWLNQVALEEEFTVVYIDIDHFKHYNDSYGFSCGDKMISLVANILKDFKLDSNLSLHLGHIGGDDFIMVFHSIIDKCILEDLCSEFDNKKIALFNETDIKEMGYIAKDRSGNVKKFPLTTISLSAFTNNNFKGKVSATELGHHAAELKSKVKKVTYEKGCSDYIYERRVY